MADIEVKDYGEELSIIKPKCDGYIVFEGVNIANIIDEISISTDQEYSTNSYIGDTGSNTSYISETGKVLKFSNLCLKNEINNNGTLKLNDYLNLKEEYKNKEGVLTSPSNANIDGNYLITSFEITEDTNNNFTIEWEFTEQVPFNVTETSFRVWSNPTKTTTTNTIKTTNTLTANTVTKLSGTVVTSNTRTLLTSCPLMSKGSTSTKCVKILQRFLQSKGYYKGYKIDGDYGAYTFKELKKLQKNNKLSQTGKWDTKTRTYFRKKLL